MSEHTHNEHEKAREGRKHHETFAERDPLTAEEPDVLESSASDPEFPAISCDGYITCAPKGKSDSFAILRHWRPMGIPMTVMQ